MIHPFPHFASLPPATPEQAAQVYTLLHVTPRIIRFDRLTSSLAILADVYVLFLYWLLLASGFSAKLRNYAEHWFPKSLYLQSVTVYALLLVSLALMGLPLSFIRGWVVLKSYGLSNQTGWQWLLDHFKGVAIGIIVGALIAGVLILLIKRFERTWPYWFAGALAPIIAFGIFLEPVIIEPLFNHFSLLTHSSPLYGDIHRLAQKAGIGDAKIYVVDKSKQTNETNAYVTGFGSSLRIVLWDTLLKQMPPREIIAISGHEMGHYVEGHLIFGFFISVAGLFIFFPALRWLALLWLTKYGPYWRLRTLHDPAALALLLLCLQIGFLIIQPISNQVSRFVEHRADAFSLGTVRDRVGLAIAFVDLSKQDLENPNPPIWEKFWFDDHPPLGERIQYALYGQPNLVICNSAE